MYLKTLSKNKKIKKSTSLFINIGCSAILALATNFLLQYFQSLGSFVGAFWWISERPATFFIGSLFIFFIYIFALSLFGNLYLGSFICLLIFCAIGFSNTNKLNILGEPLYPVDFYQVRYINSLFKMIGGNVSISTVLICIVGSFILIYILKRLPKLNLDIVTRIILLSISSFMIYSYATFNNSVMSKPITKSGVDVVLWNQPYNYSTNGFVFGLLSNLQTSVMEQPEGYNEDNVKQIAEKYIKESEIINSTKVNDAIIEKPNIIFLMNETFWDPTRLASLTFSEDPMPNIREVMSKSSSGFLLSPEFGGTTANVEFEALTGLSMYNLIPGSIPYQQSMDKDGILPSFVSMLKDQGYSTLAMHPYNKTFYKRNRVYNYLGFDEFIGEDDMKYKERFLKDSYISDQSVVNEILYELQEKDPPLFVHAVTMQNHTPIFDGKFGNNSISVEGLSNEDLRKEIETYAEGIKQTDSAIKNLIDSVATLEEPTIIVFWGDHLPALNNSIYEEAKYTFSTTAESNRALSETPLFIYSNFNLEKKELNSLSPSFLGVTLYELLELPLSPYYAMLFNIKSLIPGFKSSVLIDSNGDIKTELSVEEEELIKNYRLIQYDLLVGKKYSLPILFK